MNLYVVRAWYLSNMAQPNSQASHACFVTTNTAQEERTNEINEYLNDLLHAAPSARHMLYRGLIRIIRFSPQTQDCCQQMMSNAHMHRMAQDLSCDDRPTRMLTAQLLCRLCHANRGAQRMLSQMNGTTVAGIRVFSVPKRFENVYREWCAKQKTTATRQGFEVFIAGLVSSRAGRSSSFALGSVAHLLYEDAETPSESLID
jgi:hypothetical protein